MRNYHKLLDYMLNYLAEDPLGNGEHRRFRTKLGYEQEIINHFYFKGIKDEKGREYLQKYAIQIIEKLQADGYVELVEKDPHYKTYKITFEGIVFAQKGGYHHQDRKAKSKLYLQETQTWAMCVGTVAAGVYALKEFVSDPTCRLIGLSLTLATICAAIIVYLCIRWAR